MRLSTTRSGARRARCSGGVQPAHGDACRFQQGLDLSAQAHRRPWRKRGNGPRLIASGAIFHVLPDSLAVGWPFFVSGQIPISATAIGILARNCTLEWLDIRTAGLLAVLRVMFGSASRHSG